MSKKEKQQAIEKRWEALARSLTVEDYKSYLQNTRPKLLKILIRNSLFQNHNSSRDEVLSVKLEKKFRIRYNAQDIAEYAKDNSLSDELAETILKSAEVWNEYGSDLPSLGGEGELETEIVIHDLVYKKLQENLEKQNYSPPAIEKITDFTLGGGSYGLIGKHFWTKKSLHYYGMFVGVAMLLYAAYLAGDRFINPRPDSPPVFLVVLLGLFWAWIARELYIEHKTFTEFYPYYKKNLYDKGK